MDRQCIAELTERALSVAASLYGTGDTEVLRGLCAIHIGGIARRQSCDDSDEFFEAAAISAAYLALASLLKGRTSAVPLSFRAGDVSVDVRSAGDATAAAAALKEEARSLLDPFLEDSDFMFRGVPG